MSMNTYTLAQLLSTIKVVESRIEKATQATYISNGIGLDENRRADIGNQAVEIVEGNIQANWSRISTLLHNRNAMKMALIATNNSTEVEIGKVKMTIAQAVERKQSIKYQVALLNICKNQVSVALRTQEVKAAAMNAKIAEASKDIASSTGAKLTNITSNIALVKSQGEPFLIDPLGMINRVYTINEEIEDFLNNVDYALSAVNALTKVEVDLL